MFNDTTGKSYVSVIYQRSVYISGKMSTNLVMPKSIVARMQAIIIPKLELLSAALELRLARKLVNAFHISMDVVTFWCKGVENSNHV